MKGREGETSEDRDASVSGHHFEDDAGSDCDFSSPAEPDISEIMLN